MRAWLSLALGVASVVAALPVEAQGGRVVVERFRGPRGSTVRRALVRDFEDNGVEVVDQDEARRARRELGYGRRLDPEEVVELARSLNASAIVQGIVRRRRRRWSATVRVLDGYDGERLGDARWRGRTARSLRAVGTQAYDRLGGYLRRARAPAALAADGDVPWWERQDTDSPAERPPVEEEDDDEPRPPQTRYDAVRVSFLGGTLYRSMESQVTVYASQRPSVMPPADPASELLNETRRYASAGMGHFELGGRLELYPGAFDEAQSFPYLGAVLELTHSVAVSTHGFTPAPAREPVTVPTEQLELFVGLRFRYRFGEARREPEIHLEAGWGMFNFNLGLGDLDDLDGSCTLDGLRCIELDTIVPPMQHGYVQLAGGIEYGVAPPYLTLGAELGGRIGTNIGGETRNVWGTATGPSNGFLIGANARIEIPDLFDTFFIGLNLRYFMFTTDFQGQVGCAQTDACMGFMMPWEDRRLWEVWPVEPPLPSETADLDAVVGGPNGPVTDNYVRLQVVIGVGFN